LSIFVFKNEEVWKMENVLNRSALLLSLIAPVFLSACADDVSKSQYDSVVAENQQLRSENQQLHEHINRLQSAIKYTVNSDLLFPSGGWEISDAGKDVIAKMAHKLASEQEAKLMVNGYTDNAPIGPSLEKKGITSNQMLSEKRADAVMEYMISQGVKPELVGAQGFGESDPVAPNSTAQGRAQNRRVEVTLAPTGM
jgi:chemotaxis protein MotB